MHSPNHSKILFVDDDQDLLDTYQHVGANRFSVDTAMGGERGLESLRQRGPYSVLIVDMSMPGMSGVEFLEQAQSLAPESVRIMLTGNVDQQTAVDAVNRGRIFRFLHKPFRVDGLILEIELAIKHYEMKRAERELLEGTLMGSIKAMSEVIGLVAPDLLGLGRRLQEAMRQFGEFIGAGPSWELEVAALLSPLGAAALPLRLRQKIAARQDLTPDEAAIARRIPQAGHDLLVAIPRLGNVAQIVLLQDQPFDGSGFAAAGLPPVELPIGARMLKILRDRLDLEADAHGKQLPYAGAKERAWEAMRVRRGRYDLALLNRCFDCFEGYLGNAVCQRSGVQSLFLRDLAPNQIVIADICTTEGMVLVGAGSRLTSVSIEHLRNHAEMGGVRQPVQVQAAAKR